MAAAPPPGRLRAARVGRPHGLRGEVHVLPLGGDPERFRPGVQLLTEEDGRPLTIASARPVARGGLLVGFRGVAGRDQAEALAGRYLCVEAVAPRELGADEWFVHQLVGLRAVTPSGEELGQVADVEECPVHDILLVAGPAGRRRFPMIRAFVERVDLPGRRVVITPWEED